MCGEVIRTEWFGSGQQVQLCTMLGLHNYDSLSHLGFTTASRCVNLVLVDTLVRSGVGHWHKTVGRSLEGDQSEVSMAHRSLTKEVRTVFCEVQQVV